MKAFWWAADSTASGYYRMLLPSHAVGWLGHQTAANTAVTPEWLDGLDVVVGARTTNVEAWRQLGDLGVRRVVDLDDDYFHLDETNPARRTWTPQFLQSLDTNLASSDVVTAATEALAEEIRHHTDAAVVVIPNGLPAQLLAPVRDYDRGRVRVGWAGTGSTIHELHMASRAVKRIAEYRDDVDVRLVGVSAQMAAEAGVAHERVHTVGWLNTGDDYLTGVASFDVWVAPYRDVPFNRAKFPTKALEAGFLGIPLIASDIRPYREAIDHGVTGFLVRHDHEWGRYLRMLVDDPHLRKSMGIAARAKASASIMQSLNQRWADVLAPERIPA